MVESSIFNNIKRLLGTQCAIHLITGRLTAVLNTEGVAAIAVIHGDIRLTAANDLRESERR